MEFETAVKASSEIDQGGYSPHCTMEKFEFNENQVRARNPAALQSFAPLCGCLLYQLRVREETVK
jgi:hypothetical protein